ncbi:MAG: hypothetical protein JW832_16200 [Deltaproteobacteria bacterium]|nr:hypothetical protein [Deltaproteobacteria bacterium]
MRTEVTTKQELINAILNNVGTIHIAEAGLAADLLSRQKKNGCISYAMRMNGYRQNCKRALGVFDVSLVKAAQQAT